MDNDEIAELLHDLDRRLTKLIDIVADIPGVDLGEMEDIRPSLEWQVNHVT